MYPKSLGGKNHTRAAIYSCNEDKNLARFLPNGTSIEEFRRKLKVEFEREVLASEASTVIISNEWLHPRVHNPEEFSRLKKLLEGLFDKIQVVLYIRQQDKLALSLYSTSLKAGNYKRFKFPIVNPERPPYYYDFYSIYKNWADQLGKNNISVRVFDRKHLKDGDVVVDFLCLLNMKKEGFVFPAEENLSLSNTGVGLMRAFNRVARLFSFAINPRLLRKIRGVISNRWPGKPELATEAQCKAFLQAFDDSNQRLASELSIQRNEVVEVFCQRGQY
ncbi:hypothetical protein SAMN04487960_11216 [Marinobacter mobilis]|uniref:Uncharacterized protein n=1 Tax=Marinobacter mobilis TaxID=488533 RepID=A0A1H3DBT1_9GAMM|nr:hypothetical protein SAMN04487960_11216 [Marinobacter mobilis]